MRYYEFQINESLLSSLKATYNHVTKFFKNIFSRIEFGQKAEINLGHYIKKSSVNEDENLPKLNALAEPELLEPATKLKHDTKKAKHMVREVFDLTSMIGYYNEYEVAWKLAYGLEHNGINIKSNTDHGLRVHAENYKDYILDNIEKFKENPDQIHREMKRAQDGSEVMAKKIFDEIINAHDIKLIDVHISLTGKEAMGLGKEDVKITIKKKDTEEVKEMIKASLKLYKTASGVNVYNATFSSYLMSVITGKSSNLTGKKAIKSFLNDNPQFADEIEQVLNITDQWLVIKNKLKKEKDPNYRKAANEFITKNRGYQKMRDLMFKKIFSFFYAQDKAGINNRILHRLGLDGADDVYLLVGTEKQKMTAVSSRTSESFKSLYENLKSDFNIKFDIPDDPEIVNCNMIIESSDGRTLAKFGIGFKEGATFPHMWDMNDIVRDAKKKS